MNDEDDDQFICCVILFNQSFFWFFALSKITTENEIAKSKYTIPNDLSSFVDNVIVDDDDKF